MTFDKKLRNVIDEIPVPEELMPENIEAMLRAVAPVQERNTESAEADRKITVSGRRQNRAVIMRTLTAAAACAALAGGLAAIHDKSENPGNIESEIEYEAVQVQTYDELYNIYTGIYMNSSGTSSAQNGDGIEIITDETAITGVTEPVVSETEPPITEAAPPQETEIFAEEPDEAAASDFSDADIVKSDENSVYYIRAGKLCVVNKADMTVAAEIDTVSSPFEMYVRGSSLILIGAEKASADTSVNENNVVAEIFDISSGMPERSAVYKQNGVYSSVRVDEDGVIYIVTGYSDYRETPLDENADLESYVPGYYINGEKKYVAAEDISIPKGANNTDYTVVSRMNCGDPSSLTVKAVLGSSLDAHCSESTLYVTGSCTRDNKEYTTVTSFNISGSRLECNGSAVLEGTLVSRHSMVEYGGLFRIATISYDSNSMIVTNIFTLDSRLQEISSAKNLLPGVMTGLVKFTDNTATIYAKGRTEPELVIDLSQSAPVENTESDEFFAAYVNKIGDQLVGITARENADGVNSLVLELYSGADGRKTAEIEFGDIPCVGSPALTDKKAMLIDEEHGIVGVPVSGISEFGTISRYYVFSVGEGNITEKGVIEFNDITDGYSFERAVVSDDVLIIVGSGRIASVLLEDMTVIETVDFK